MVVSLGFWFLPQWSIYARSRVEYPRGEAVRRSRSSNRFLSREADPQALVDCSCIPPIGRHYVSTKVLAQTEKHP
jgi:hypothetical protein